MRVCPAGGHRFTPTGVGTISVGFVNIRFLAVHPHGRGDNVERDVQEGCEFGSPPRAWGQCSGDCGGGRVGRFTPTGVGTIKRQRDFKRFPRFTPTGVGTISFVLFAAFMRSVHPHGRGDNIRSRRWMI